MNDNIDPYKRGHHANTFNKVNELKVNERFKIQDARATRLTEENQRLYQEMRDAQTKEFFSKIAEQEKEHRRKFEKMVIDKMSAMEFYYFKNVGPKTKRLQAEKQATYALSLLEKRDQEHLLISQLRQAEGYLDYALKQQEHEQSLSKEFQQQAKPDLGLKK